METWEIIALVVTVTLCGAFLMIVWGAIRQVQRKSLTDEPRAAGRGVRRNYTPPIYEGGND